MPPRKETEVVDKEKQTADEPSAVIEPQEGELEAQIESLGTAVTANQQDEQGSGDAEGQHNASIDAMNNITEALQVSSGEAVFDVRDFLIDQIKNRPKPWSATSQAEQRDVAAACEHAAKEVIRKVLEVVASGGQKAIRVLLTKVNAGGDDIVITGKVKFLDAEPSERDQAILNLHHGIGKHVMLNRASVDDYSGGGREAETDEDQPAMQFEADASDDDEQE